MKRLFTFLILLSSLGLTAQNFTQTEIFDAGALDDSLFFPFNMYPLDFNEDGRIDLVNRLAYAKAEEDGTYGPYTRWVEDNGGQGSIFVNFTDYNADGIKDLIFTTRIILRNAQGGHTVQEFEQGSILAAEDFNADGNTDLVVLTSSPSPTGTNYLLKLILRNETGENEEHLILDAGSRSFSNQKYKVADVNNDGHSDFICFHNYSLLIFHGGSEMFLNPFVLPTPGYFSVGQIETIDYTNDNRKDILFTLSNRIFGYESLPDGNYKEGKLIYGREDDVYDNTRFAAADFDGDGDVDLAVTALDNNRTGITEILHNLQNGYFSAPVLVKDFTGEETFREFYQGTIHSFFLATDWNGDSIPDLYLCNTESKKYFVFLNEPDSPSTETDTPSFEAIYDNQEFTYEWLHPKPFGHYFSAAGVKPNGGVVAGTAHGHYFSFSEKFNRWELQGVLPYQPAFYKIKFFDNDNGIAHTDRGLLSTQDGGKSWKNILGQPAPHHRYIFLDQHRRYLYTHRDLEYTENGELNLSSFFSENNVYPSLVAFEATSDNNTAWLLNTYQGTNMLLSVKRYSGQVTEHFEIDRYSHIRFVTETVGYIFQNNNSWLKTTDGGETWFNISTAFTDGSRVRGFAFKNENEGVVYFLSGKSFYTTDGGNVWKELKGGLPQQRVELIYNGSYLILGSLGGRAYLDTETLQWKSKDFYNSNNLAAPQGISNMITVGTGGLGKVVFDGDSTVYYLYSTNRGETWNKNKIPVNYYGYLYTAGDNIYYIQVNGEILRSYNNGKNWIREGHFYESIFYPDIHNFFYVNDNISYLTAYRYVYKVKGSSIERTNINVTGNSEKPVGLFFLNENTGLTITNRGNTFQTTDGGVSWQEFSPDFWLYPDHAKLAFTDEQNGWLLEDENRWYRTRNGGRTWEEQNLHYLDEVQSIDVRDGRSYLTAQIQGAPGFRGLFVFNPDSEDWYLEHLLPIGGKVFFGSDRQIILHNGSKIIELNPEENNRAFPSAVNDCLNIFPNPTRTYANVAAAGLTGSLHIFDIQGREIFTDSNFTGLTYTETYEWGKGTYIAVVRDTEGNISCQGKFVVTN